MSIIYAGMVDFHLLLLLLGLVVLESDLKWTDCTVTRWTECLTLAACGQCWELRNGISGIVCYYESKIMALHHSLYREKESILMEKSASLLQIYPIFLMISLFYIYLGVRQKMVVLCFALGLKLNSSWFQNKKEKSPLLPHWNIWDSTPSTPWPKIYHKDFWNKNRQMKSDAIPWTWKYFRI